jgi:hypothetical protein
MPSSGMLRSDALVRTDVSEKPSASIIRVTKIGELGRTLAVTNGRPTLRRKYQVTGFGVVDWISLAQDRYWWRALVNSVMNLRCGSR